MAELFNLHFESDLSEVTETDTDSHCNWSDDATATALAGTSGAMKSTLVDQTVSYGLKTLASPDTSGTLRFRFYINPDSFYQQVANYSKFDIVAVKNSGTDSVVSVQAYKGAGAYNSVMVAIWNDAGAYSGSTAYQIDAGSHYIEVQLVRGAGTGAMTWWIDGAPKTGLASIDNDTRFANVSTFRIGLVDNIPAITATCDLYFDEFTANNDGSEIGPLGGGASNTLEATEAITAGSDRALFAKRALTSSLDPPTGVLSRMVLCIVKTAQVYHSWWGAIVSSGANISGSVWNRQVLAATRAFTGAVARTLFLGRAVDSSSGFTANLIAYGKSIIPLVAKMVSVSSLGKLASLRKPLTANLAAGANTIRKRFASLTATMVSSASEFVGGTRMAVLSATVLGICSSWKLMWQYTLGAATTTVGSAAGARLNKLIQLISTTEAASAAVIRRFAGNRAISTATTSLVGGLAKRGRFVHLQDTVEYATAGTLIRTWCGRLLSGANAPGTATTVRWASFVRSFVSTVAGIGGLFGTIGQQITMAAEALGVAALGRQAWIAVQGLSAALSSASSQLSRSVSAFRELSRAYFITAGMEFGSKLGAYLAATMAAAADTVKTAFTFRTLDATAPDTAETFKAIVSSHFTTLLLEAVSIAQMAIGKQAFLYRSLGVVGTFIANLFARYGYFPFDPPLTVRCLVASRTVRSG